MGREVDPSDIGKHPELIKSKSKILLFTSNFQLKFFVPLFYRSTNRDDEN